MAHPWTVTRDSVWAHAVSVDGVVIDRGNKAAMEKVRKAHPGSTLWAPTTKKIGERIG